MINYAVCMATYNGGKYLREQIDSIISQLEGDDILIVSDDGSTDDTLSILNSYNGRLIVVNNQRLGGVVANFEFVLSAAYKLGARNIVLVDQDDKWVDQRMSYIRESLNRYDLVMMNGYVSDAALARTGQTVFQQVKVRRGFIKNLVRPSYVGCCMAFRRAVLGAALPFPKKLPWHDWFISLIAELFFSVGLDSRPSIYYRRHDMNYSATGGKSTNGIGRKIVLRFLMLWAIYFAVIRRIFTNFSVR